MSNLSDKEIDRLSREAADFYEPDDSPLNWSRLEQKLNEQMPERPPDSFRFGRISPYLWGAAIVVFTGISFFIFKNSRYSQSSTLNSQPVNQSAPSATTDNRQADGNAIRLDSLSSAGALHADDDANPVSGTQPVLSAGTETTDNKSSSGKPEKGAGNNPGGSSGGLNASNNNSANHRSKGTADEPGNKNKRNSQTGSKSIVPASLLSAGFVSGGTDKKVSQGHVDDLNSSESSRELNNVEGSARNKNKLSLPSVVVASAEAGHVQGNDSLLYQLARKYAKTQSKSLHINRSLNFGLTFGPDYTDAGGIENNQIGNNIGLTVGYYLTSKLSVNSGFIYSNRFYWSPGHESNQVQYLSVPTQYGNAATFAAPPPVEYVNGSSNIWELPLTLRYDFAKNQKTKFFANAGLSSYFIMKQTNIYFFHNGQRTAAWKSSNNEQLNYWFGVADISVGLETSIGKGFSFQMEPYFKIPLKKMGVENLKLESYGFLISFKYSPVLSRTKK